MFDLKYLVNIVSTICSVRLLSHSKVCVAFVFIVMIKFDHDEKVLFKTRRKLRSYFQNLKTAGRQPQRRKL